MRVYLEPLCTPGQIRLVNGSSANEGRVEMCLDGVWGTLCGNFWIEVDSLVTCRQLGYNDYSKYFSLTIAKTKIVVIGFSYL